MTSSSSSSFLLTGTDGIFKDGALGCSGAEVCVVQPLLVDIVFNEG
jgi:hypothetical protein